MTGGEKTSVPNSRCAQAWKPSSQHAGEKRGVAGLLLGRTERAARAADPRKASRNSLGCRTGACIEAWGFRSPRVSWVWGLMGAGKARPGVEGGSLISPGTRAWQVGTLGRDLGDKGLWHPSPGGEEGQAQGSRLSRTRKD